MANAITVVRRGIEDFVRHTWDAIRERLGWHKPQREMTAFEAYMEQTRALAEQYEREAPVFKTEELEALYDDAYFAARARQRTDD